MSGQRESDSKAMRQYPYQPVETAHLRSWSARLIVIKAEAFKRLKQHEKEALQSIINEIRKHLALATKPKPNNDPD